MDAEQYMKHWGKGNVWKHLSWDKHQRRLARCARYLAERPDPFRDYFADVGCAYGHSTLIMKKFMPVTGRGLYWAGVDFSPTAVAMAKKFFPDGNWFYFKNPQAMTAGGPFEGVVCSEVIEHAEDDQGLVKALLSITERRLVLTTPIKRVSDPGHLRVYDEATLGELLTGAKKAVIERDDYFYYAIMDLV